MRFQLINRSPSHYVGWHRTVIDPKSVPEDAAKIGRGYISDGSILRWALGRMIGPSSQAFDLEIALAPGQSLTVDPDKFIVKPWEPSPLPVPLEQFGWPELNGYTMEHLASWIDGANVCVRWGVRLPPSCLIAAFLVMRYVPGEVIASGMLTVCASNPTIPDMTAPLPQLTLTGLGAWDTLCPIDPGYIGDGQARHWPVCVDFTKDSDDPRRQAVMLRQIQGHGLTTVGPLGIPEQMRFDPVRWRNMGDNVRKSTEGYGIAWPPVGVAANSTVTGDQETQGYGQGFESFYPGGVGADVPRFWAALGQGRQPCHYLMQDGRLAFPEDFPTTMLWQGAPLWISKTGGTPSWFALGKPRQRNTGGNNDTQGWHGPDREHLLIHDIASAYELSGEECLLWELEHHARNFLWEDTTEPQLSTSGPDAARSFGWRGLFIAHLLRLLPAGKLRDRVLARWVDRIEKVYLPSWGGKLVWQLFESKATEINGYPRMWPAYQQAIGSFGGYIGCAEALKLTTDVKSTTTLKLGMAMCVVGAEHVVDRCYEIYSSQALPGQAPPFKEWELIGSDNAGNLAPHWHDAPYVEGVSAHRTGWFRHAWMPPALWIVGVASQKELRHLARSVLNTLMGELRGNPNNGNLPDWYPPLPANLQ